MVRLTRIYTKGGDQGETSLGDGTRVPKQSLRVKAFGTVDEANAAIGPARLHAGGEALDMLGMETVAERMADYFVGHHPAMPGSGKTTQAVDAARRPEDSAHASVMTGVPRPGQDGDRKFDRITAGVTRRQPPKPIASRLRTCRGRSARCMVKRTSTSSALSDRRAGLLSQRDSEPSRVPS